LYASVLLPLGLALSLTGVLRWMLGAHWGKRLAATAVGVALLVAHALTFGAPVWPALSGVEKLPLLFVLLLAGGLAIEIWRPGRNAVAAVTVAAVVAIVLWLAWPQLGDGGMEMLWLLGPAAVLALASLAGLAAAKPGAANRPAMIVLAALGLAGASFNAGSLTLLQAALALAAAVGGFALWNWPVPRLPFNVVGVAVGALGCFAVALLLLLLTEIRPWALLPLPLIFLSDALSRRLPAPERLGRPAVEPVYVVAIGVIPAVLAILLAQAPPQGDLYYR
jgi:hypothetical protein